MCVRVSTHIKVKGQFGGVGSFLPLLGEFENHIYRGQRTVSSSQPFIPCCVSQMSFWQLSLPHLPCPPGAHWIVDTCVTEPISYVRPA